MNKNEMRAANRGQKINSLSNMVQLKLVQSSHTSFNKNKPLTSIINTPSTIDDFKKFHSCDIHQTKDTSKFEREPKLNAHSRTQSATKILSLHEIKKQQSKLKDPQKPFQERMQKVNGSSRKIFISISKRSDKSQQKKKETNPEIKEGELGLMYQQPKQQFIKLNIYKNIARKNQNNEK